MECLWFLLAFWVGFISTPLNEMGAKAFPVITFQPQTITPLDKMRVPENVLVIGAPPDEHQWTADSPNIKSYKSADENGWTLVKGLIGIVIFMVVRAGLKRL